MKKYPLNESPKTVSDCFCGGGGMSLGFEGAGFKIIYGLDNWEIACRTFKSNFRLAGVVCEDALKIDPSDVPSCDVLIGGPPCQEFSSMNAKKPEEPDLSLINWFIDVAKELKPEYWIMENVPAVRKYLPNNIMKRTYRMCDYGVPQIRQRVFAGYFKEPQKVRVEPRFPAIVATEYKASPGKRQRTRFWTLFKRISLIPECLAAQTFPLDYILHGTLKDRYRLIGNAVPPIMAFRLADAILNPGQTLISG